MNLQASTSFHNYTFASSSSRITKLYKQHLKSQKPKRMKDKEAAFKAACPIVKPSFLKPTRGENPC
ncbi:hypothetical protein LXL04_018261 [Taraxacum kok-saghyz]